jgi:hypothetical protein
MDSISFKAIGTLPLLLHNGALADPLNKWSKAIAKVSSKRHKTEADHQEIAKLEFLGSLYLNGGTGPVIPAPMLEATLIVAAKSRKEGQKAKAGIFVPADMPLIYDGPGDPMELWESGSFVLRVPVRVGQNKVVRTRPMFNGWAIAGRIEFRPDIVDQDTVGQWMVIAGNRIGLGDWRPRFGLFSVTFD